MKKIISLLLAVLMIFAFAACGNEDLEEQKQAVQPADFSIGALKGPTAMGLAEVIAASQELETAHVAKEALHNNYSFELAGSPDELVPALLRGDLDIACLPANLAAVLYAKSEGKIKVIGINTLGVIYIVDTDGSVKSMEDLKGKTIVASGQGSTPEFALKYLLSENGIDVDKDVDIQWRSEHAECVTDLVTGKATVAMLPQPFVTVAKTKISSLNTALDLTQEWEKLDQGSSLITGVVVARTEVIDTYSKQLEGFLEDYAASVDFVNSQPEKAGEIIGELGIVDAAIAEKAIPYCNIVCITGDKVKERLDGYLEVLFTANPASTGGSLPDDEFYL